MKKLTIGMAMACGIMFTSCNVGEGENSSVVPVPTCNYIIALDGSESTMSNGYYSFSVTSSTAGTTYKISTDNLTFNNVSRSFETVETTPTALNNMMLYFTGLTSNGITGNSAITDGTFLLTYYNLPENFKSGDYFTPTVKKSDGTTSYVDGFIYYPGANYVYTPLVAGYRLGNDYMVRTFMSDAFYNGTTVTRYTNQDGMTETYTSSNILHRIIIDMSKKKACLVMYNAKFSNSPNEPEKKVIYVPDLDVRFVGSSYEITGTDITPLIPEGSDSTAPSPDTFTPQPNFIFSSFRMTMTNTWLTEAKMEYKVGNDYEGTFTGSYAVLPDVMK